MIIQNIQELTEELDKLSPGEDFFDFLKSIDIDSIDFGKLQYWNRDHYTRNCIASSDEYELLLVCWEKGQMSPIHDYAAREAWIHIVDGCLEEQMFTISSNNLVPDKKSVLKKGEYSYMDSSCIHRFKNLNDGRTMSLHLYTNPIDFWTIYNERTLKSRKVKVNYDTILGERIFM